MAAVLVDSNVLLDVATNDPEWIETHTDFTGLHSSTVHR